MIPGPVNGHVPIDPGAAQRRTAEAAGEHGADSGTSFAGLLAGMLSPGDGQTGAEEGVFDRLDAAEMFNETGLFRGAVPLQSQGAMPDALSVAEAVSAAAGATPGLKADLQALAARLDAAQAAPGVTTTRAGASGGAAPASGGAGAGAKAPHSGLHLLQGQPVAMRAGPAQAATAAPEAAGGSRVSSRTAAVVAQLLVARTGAAAAQVSVRAADGGINVMARVDRLSREERDRLRGEIGELLARRGFTKAEIVLNGEAWPLPKGKEE